MLEAGLHMKGLWLPMTEIGLNDLIDDWLSGSRRSLWLRFSPLLEARFEADTGSARSRTMMVFGTLGFLVGVLIYPVLREGMPDVAAQTKFLYLQISMPLGFLLSGFLRSSPRPYLREGAMLLANSVCVCVTMYLAATSRSSYTSLLVAGVTVLMVYSAIGIQLRLKFALAAMMIILVTYWVALDQRPDIGGLARRDLLVLACCTATYLMLANWRMELEQRRSYLLVLRETLQSRVLSLQNKELDALARRDPLTGLANRRAYDSWLAGHWAQEGARQGQLGLIVLDVDRFKAFNDFYGHAQGDACLQKIALCLRDKLRGTTDLVARLGGEEFAILLPSLCLSLSAEVAERMRLAVQQLELPHAGLGPHGFVTVSAGVASHQSMPGADSASLFQAADTALYQAKLSGRNRVCVASMADVSAISAAAAD